MTCFVLVPGWVGLLLTLVELVSFGKVTTFHCFVFFEKRWSRPDPDVNFNFDKCRFAHSRPEFVHRTGGKVASATNWATVLRLDAFEISSKYFQQQNDPP